MLLSPASVLDPAPPVVFPPFDSVFTERHHAIAAVFQEIWARTQRELPDDSPNRAKPVRVHRTDPTRRAPGGTAVVCAVDLSRLTQRQLPHTARRANLETAAFIDGWITDYLRTGGTVQTLTGSPHELRLVLLLYAFWSTIRLAPDGRKRDFSVGCLPTTAVREIARWRALSLGPQGDTGIDRLMASTFIRTPYQATLDRRMIRGAVECHRLPLDGIAQLARVGGWVPGGIDRPGPPEETVG